MQIWAVVLDLGAQFHDLEAHAPPQGLKYPGQVWDISHCDQDIGINKGYLLSPIVCIAMYWLFSQYLRLITSYIFSFHSIVIDQPSSLAGIELWVMFTIIIFFGIW